MNPFRFSPGPALALSSVLLGLVALAPAIATAQQMFKWTDENGQVHYSDHAPPGQTTTNLPLPKAPRPSKPVNAPGAGSPNAADNSSRNQHAAQDESEADRDRRKSEEDKQRMFAKMRANQQAADKAADQAVIAECRANRETYCKGGADQIRERENLKANLQWAEAQNHHDELANRGIYTPTPRPPAGLPTKTKICDKGNQNCRYEWSR
jgi:Domain of unknown function (DUF4124)